jgi:hypothetical protein
LELVLVLVLVLAVAQEWEEPLQVVAQVRGGDQLLVPPLWPPPRPLAQVHQPQANNHRW